LIQMLTCMSGFGTLVVESDLMTNLDLTPFVLLTDKPVIIDATGEYITRNNQRVRIDNITSPNGATFNCKGYIFKTKPGSRKAKITYNIWHPSGAVVAVGISPDDIVKKA